MKVKLGDVCEINPKVDRLSNDTQVSFIPMQNVTDDGKVDSSIIRTVEEVKKGFTSFRENDVLFAKITTCMENGKGGIARNLKNGFGFGSTEFHVLRPSSSVTSEWLYYILSWPVFRKECEKNMTGSAGQKRVPKSFLENYILRVPPLDEQRRIAAVLDKVSDLIAKRREQLDKLDELVKARFVEMFGDPESNPKKWNLLSFREAGVRLSDGPFGSNLKSEHYTTEGVRVIRLGNIGVGQFIDNDKSYISEQHYEKLRKYTCRSGEIVIGTLGDPNLRACLVPKTIEYAINKADCVHYIPKPEILNTRFVCQYINCPETLLLASGMVHGQTRSRISSGQLAEMPIFVPPMELQEQYAAFAEQVDKSKLTIQQSLDKMETLKKALMQEYFG